MVNNLKEVKRKIIVKKLVKLIFMCDVLSVVLKAF